MGIGISREREFKAFDKVGSELADKLEAGAELAIERRPAYLYITSDSMQTVRKPDIDVDRHGAAGPDRPQRALTDRHWMLAECLIELFIQQDAILPEAGLIARCAGH